MLQLSSGTAKQVFFTTGLFHEAAQGTEDHSEAPPLMSEGWEHGGDVRREASPSHPATSSVRCLVDRSPGPSISGWYPRPGLSALSPVLWVVLQGEEEGGRLLNGCSLPVLYA